MKSNSDGTSETWHIGYAETTITPRPGECMLFGYARERAPADEHAPLIAQALALRDARGAVSLLIAADILGFDRTTVDSIRTRLARDHGLPEQRVMLAPSHTHWGPASTFRVGFAAGSPNVHYLARMEQRLLEAGAEAIASLQPGGIRFREFNTRIGANRRSFDEHGSQLWLPNLEGSYDEHTPVLEFERAGRQGPRRILLVSHACHPTSSGLMDRWSPDYPGALRDRVREKLGAETRVVFTMGCGADAKVTHIDRKSGKPAFSASPARAREAGRRLAKAVLGALRTDDGEAIAPTLDAALVTGALTFEKPRNERQLQTMAYDGDLAAPHAWWARQMLAYPDSRKALRYDVQAWRASAID